MSGLPSALVARNPSPQPCGSDPHPIHSDMKSTSTEDVAPFPKVNSTWHVPAPLAFRMTYDEFGGHCAAGSWGDHAVREGNGAHGTSPRRRHHGWLEGNASP